MATRGADATVEKTKTNGGRFRFQPRPWRFKLKKGEDAKIIFLHDYEDSIVLSEHRFDILSMGKPIYGNALTCAAMVGEECPLCQVKKKFDLGYVQNMRFFSIIDTRPYKPKQGPEKKYQRLILAQPYPMERAFSRHASRLADQRNNGHDLRGAKFEVIRPDDPRSCAIGTQYDYIGIQKLKGSSTYADDDIVPYGDEEFAVDMEMLEDAASILTDRSTYDDEDEEEETEIKYS